MGYGDEIMVTGFARIAKKKYPDLQIVIGNKKRELIYESIIYKNNPNITKIDELNHNLNKVWIENYVGNRPYIIKTEQDKLTWDSNFRTIKGDFFFDENEKVQSKKIINRLETEWESKNKKKFEKIIYIETSRINKSFDGNLLGFYNRDWGYENWKKFVDNYKHKYLFIQSLHPDSKKIDGIYSFKSNFREACAVMSLSDFYVGWEGGFAHAAAALDKKALVLFGGWIDPQITGYSFHKNLYVNIKGSPCGMQKFCSHCEKCKKLLTHDLVFSNFEKLIN